MLERFFIRGRLLGKEGRRSVSGACVLLCLFGFGLGGGGGPLLGWLEGRGGGLVRGLGLGGVW